MHIYTFKIHIHIHTHEYTHTHIYVLFYDFLKYKKYLIVHISYLSYLHITVLGSKISETKLYHRKNIIREKLRQ